MFWLGSNVMAKGRFFEAQQLFEQIYLFLGDSDGGDSYSSSVIAADGFNTVSTTVRSSHRLLSVPALASLQVKTMINLVNVLEKQNLDR